MSIHPTEWSVLSNPSINIFIRNKLHREQEIRSVELGVCPMQLFHFWSRDVHPVQNLLLCTKFYENRLIFHWEMAIYRFSKWRPSAILELFYHHTRPPAKPLSWSQLPVKFHVNLIHRSEDIAIWIFRIFGLKCLFRPPKWGFWETLDPPKCDYSSLRPPKGTSLRKSTSVKKLSTVKICWGVWPVGELTESLTDTQTHIGKFIFCPCIALDRQWMND